jgi:serine/threonine-protein kinase
MIGTQVGAYRIDEKLGEGGMGTVYRATEVKIERPVAIKVLNSDLAQKPAIVERFIAEARAQANLNHPNVAVLYAFLSEHGNAMMVMEYVDGENFQQLVNRRGAIPSAEAIPLFKQALAGVGAAHEMGIVHRDIKPANIMLNKRGVVKVMDFGIAKVIGERGLTRTGVQLGTVFYMSPEQVRGFAADARSDIYALGVTLYEMLTAHVPFNAASEYDVLTDHVNTAPPLPSTHNANIPKGVEGIVLKALEKKPEDRFQTVEEFSAALDRPEEWEGFLPKAAMVTASHNAPTEEINAWRGETLTHAVPRPGMEVTLPPPAPASFWTPLRMGVAAFAAILLLGAGGYLYFSRSLLTTPPKAVPAAATATIPEPAPPPPLAPMPEEKQEEAAPKAEPVHLVIPAKTEVHVRLTTAIDGTPAEDDQVFPVALDAPISVEGKTVAAKSAAAQVILLKATGSAKSPKLLFQLASLRVDGKTYKVRSDTFEFKGSTHGKRVGKLGGIGNALGSLVGGKHSDASLMLPADTEMSFILKSPVAVTVH